MLSLVYCCLLPADMQLNIVTWHKVKHVCSGSALSLFEINNSESSSLMATFLSVSGRDHQTAEEGGVRHRHRKVTQSVYLPHTPRCGLCLSCISESAPKGERKPDRGARSQSRPFSYLMWKLGARNVLLPLLIVYSSHALMIFPSKQCCIWVDTPAHN